MNGQKIALLTDSCADIPKALQQKYDIFVVPLKLRFSDGEYADGVDITPAEVYRRLYTCTGDPSLRGPEWDM